MKKFFFAIAVLAATVLCGGRLSAQEVTEEPTIIRDTIIYRMADAVDSTLVGISLLEAMPSDVNVHQSHKTSLPCNR